MKKNLNIVFLLIFIGGFIYFYLPVLQGKIPAPLDTLVGLYHPFLDYFAKGDPSFRGIPFKNFLIGDPVVQIIPWKSLVMNLFHQGAVPLWNPYQMAGYPLLANIQSSAFYPLNILLFFLPFLSGWTLLIISEQLLAALFMYIYLRNLSLEKSASLFGAFVFSFCGFFIAWLEWGTIIHTALWLPLILFAIDKFCEEKKTKWVFLITVCFICSYLGGHLQTFFYSSLLSIGHLCFRSYQKKNIQTFLYGISGFLLGSIVLLPLILPQLQLLSLSARNVDQDWHQVGWFIPWQHLTQFIAPDYFGNPTTLNYWGVWNYGEFIGYIGIIPLIFALTAVFFRKDKKTFFYTCVVLLSLAFALPTVLAKLPFRFSLPFLSTTQPTRLIYIVDFALAILAALGFDLIQKTKVKVFIPAITVLLLILCAFVFGLYANANHLISSDILSGIDPWSVTKRNLILPFGFALSACVLSLGFFWEKKHELIKPVILILLFTLSVIDLLFFANKFTPFSTPNYFYPQTKLISFLQQNLGNYRIMSTDRSILHPNIPTYYHIQSVDGYDPLYLQTYGEFIAAMERRQPNIQPPFGFNRILTPNSFFEKFGSLLGVKYLLSGQELDIEAMPYLKKVYTEGTINVYENKNVLPRVFFVSSIRKTGGKQQTIDTMFEPNLSLLNTAIVQTSDAIDTQTSPYVDVATITKYSPNIVHITAQASKSGFLVLTDSYYPTWHAYIDGREVKIYQTDFAFRGIVVPKGTHTIEFKDQLF
jgi:uncharacterized membrane protein YfhO